MSTKNHPSIFNCYKAALPDEPMFVMLARDPAAPATLRYWAEQRRLLGKVATEDDQERIAEAIGLAYRMENWRTVNSDPLGGTPTWRLPRPEGEWGAPVEYVPAERDGEEAVRLNIEWLKSLLTGLESGERHSSEIIALLRLAMNSPDRRQKDALGGPVAAINGQPTVDTKPDDLAHAPEVPPHRFSQFIKGKRYAYARGLEVNPTHLPIALDEMAKDGWNLLAIFGQTDSASVGFIFERYSPPLYRVEMGKPIFDGFAAQTKPQSDKMDAYQQGIPLADIDVTGYGRGLQP